MQPEWIPGAIDFFVMLPDAVRPWPEPVDERRRALLAGGRVTEDDPAFSLVERTGLVQNGGGNVELADVVEQGRPLQLGALVGVEAHFIGQ